MGGLADDLRSAWASGPADAMAEPPLLAMLEIRANGIGVPHSNCRRGGSFLRHCLVHRTDAQYAGAVIGDWRASSSWHLAINVL